MPVSTIPDGKYHLHRRGYDLFLYKNVYVSHTINLQSGKVSTFHFTQITCKIMSFYIIGTNGPLYLCDNNINTFENLAEFELLGRYVYSTHHKFEDI